MSNNTLVTIPVRVVNTANSAGGSANTSSYSKSGASNISTGQVSVGNTSTIIVLARVGRDSVTVMNESATVIRVGNNSVSLTTGIKLAGVDGANITINGGAAIYGIATTGTANTSFIESY